MRPTRISSGKRWLTSSIWAETFSSGVRSLVSLGRQVDAVDVPVLVAAVVLAIEDVLAGVGPEVAADAALLVLGDRLGGVGIVDRADPDVEHAVDRGQVAELLAVGADAGGGLVGVAEQHAAGNEVGLRGLRGRCAQQAKATKISRASKADSCRPLLVDDDQVCANHIRECRPRPRFAAEF